MSEHSTTHGAFTIKRDLEAPLPRVWAAFSDPAAKARWFTGHNGWAQQVRTMDFRVGGGDRVKGQFPNGGPVSDFIAHYLEIIPEARIIYSYEMKLNDRRISFSLATIAFKAKGARTTLTITEQGVFLDGYDDNGSREQGTNILVDQIAASLAH